MIEKKHDPLVQTSLTSFDVARRAGVSRTTVSYVLNKNGHGHVSEETRMKVLQAAHEMGYSTHHSARALRKGQSDEICLIVDLPLTIHRTELFVSLQQHALDYGYPAVVYFNHGLPLEQVEKQLRKIFARRPIGIFATAESMTAEHVALAKSMGVNNIVLYSVKPITYARTIILPTVHAGKLAALHLLERGHRRLGLVHPVDPLHQYGFLRRLEGMCSVLSDLPEATLDILPLDYSLPSAHTLVDSAFTGASHPTGIYGYNDEYALLLLGALLDRGKHVPQDVAVLGTDDISFDEFMRPSLTSIRFDAITLGKHAVEMLVSAYNAQPIPEEFSRTLMPQLIPRGST
jgi:LacI family transcriptional regulator